MDFDSMTEMQRRLHNAACVLSADGDEHGFERLQRDAIAEIERLSTELYLMTADRDSWRDQAADRDCRTCAHHTYASGGCVSALRCVGGDRYQPTQPRQLWEQRPPKPAPF